MGDAEHPEPAESSDEEERNKRATALLDEAQQAALEHGRAVVAEARAVRRRMLEDAERRRQQIVDELERLKASIDETLAALATPASDVPGSDVPGSDVPGSNVPESPEPHDPERAVALFDQLRAEPPKSKAPMPKSTKRKAEPAKADAPTSAEPAADASGPDGGNEIDEPASSRADVAEGSAAPTDSVLHRRNTLLEPLLPDVVRSSKRLLQDEQNSLLDAVRRARGKHEANRLLPEPGRQRETWTALLAPSFNAAYLGGRAAAGKTGRVSSAPERVVIELAAALLNPLRERITVTIDAVVAEGPYESPNELQRALGSAIGARFREWRGVDLEGRILDVLDAAYARGAYEASGPAAMLEWVPDEPGRCPDCDDNALEPTLKGKPFPTGQTHPPAHPGCRCVALPVDARG
jgi:hypothetical protein